MATVTKKDLIDRIAQRSGCKRADVKRSIQGFLDEIIVELERGNRLEFRDFGVFEVKDRAPRMAQNPKTLERVPVPAKRTVKFKVGRLMKERLEAALEEPLPRIVVTKDPLGNGQRAGRVGGGQQAGQQPGGASGASAGDDGQG